MSILGTVDQLPLHLLLRRIETYAKTGFMVVTHEQDAQAIEMYFREGRLMYAAYQHTTSTLGQQLVQDGMIVSQVLQQAIQLANGSGKAVPGETRLALILMEQEWVSREELRSWMTKKVVALLRALLAWKHGTIDFDEQAPAPSERLLVSLTITSLLDTLALDSEALHAAEEEPMQQRIGADKEREERYIYVETQLVPVHDPASRSEVETTRPQSDISQAKTLFESAQFFAKPTESPLPLSASTLLSPPPISDSTIPASSLFDMNTFISTINAVTNTGQDFPLQSIAAAITPAPVASSAPARTVDISFMKPDMVMVPAEQSQAREQHVQITQEQWHLLTRVDGQTSLQDLCEIFRQSASSVCTVAGQLVAERVIHVVLPQVVQAQQAQLGATPPTPIELSPASQELVMAGLHNGLATPGYHASVAQPWGDMLPHSSITQISSSFKTQSQWGNGGNGASFVPGQGWVAPVQSLQPLPLSGPLAFGSDPYLTVQRKP